MEPVSEELRRAVVDFLNSKGEAVYPNAGLSLEEDYEGSLYFSWSDKWGSNLSYHVDHDLLQFLLEYTIV